MIHGQSMIGMSFRRCFLHFIVWLMFCPACNISFKNSSSPVVELHCKFFFHFSDRYHVYIDALEQLASHPVVISKHDLPQPERYQEFFRNFRRDSFKSLSYHCYFFSKCWSDWLIAAIKHQFPELLRKCKTMLHEKDACKAGSDSCRRQ